jgi:hypothetical protein
MKAKTPTAQARVEDIVRIRLDGAEAWQARHYVAEKELAKEKPWTIAEGGKPLSERQIRYYVEQADALIAASCRQSRKARLRRHMAQRRSLYARAVQAGDVRAALAVLSDLARMENLYPSPDEELLKKTAALRKELAELKAKGARGGDGSGDTPQGTRKPDR